MSLVPTATVQDTSYNPNTPGFFVASVTFDTVALPVAIASQEPLAALIGVANGLPAGTRILGILGSGGTAVITGGVGESMSVRGANLEFRNTATQALLIPAALAGIICTFLCTR